MTAPSSTIHPHRDLPRQQRYITTHDEAGRAVFSSEFPTAACYSPIIQDLDGFLAYITTRFPVRMASDVDIVDYRHFLEDTTPAIANKGGTVVRACNFAPGTTTAMHRTISLDFGIVVAGEVELVLDSGDVRLLEIGDIAIQRGTMHAWRVPSMEHWARMIFILQEAEPVKVGGVKLGEDYGGIPLPPSDS